MYKKVFTTMMALSVLLTACQQQKTEKSAPSDGASQKQNAVGQTVPSRKVHPKTKIRKNVPLAAEFQNIISIGSVNIIYTQADQFSIEMEGDSSLLRYTDVDIESGVLTLQINADGNKDINLYESNFGINAHVSAPSLHCVSLCGSGNFCCPGRWTAPAIHIGCMNRGQFDVQEIDCETFRFESTGEDHSTFHAIKAGKASLFAYRHCLATFVLDCDRLEVDADGESELTLTGPVHSKVINQRGKAIVNDKTTAQ